LVAVVMGGSSGGSRDARMRELISEKIAQASTKRTASMVAEASGTSDVKPEPMVVTKAEAKPEPMVVAKAEPKPEPMVVTKPEPRGRPKPGPKVRGAKPQPAAGAKARAGVARRQRTEPPRALHPSRPAGRAGGNAVGAGRHGGANASARRCRLDRADPTGAGQDADGQSRGADRIARAIARCFASCRTSACRGGTAAPHTTRPSDTPPARTT